MKQRQCWLLMDAQEISTLYFSNNVLFRKQKSYFNRTENVVMIARFEEALKIANSIKNNLLQSAGE